MRVVLYAEGPGEGASLGPLAPSPNTPLRAEHFGPGHLLLERMLREHAGVDDIRFVAPLRDKKGRSAYGSRLLDRAVLSRLLTWPSDAPDLAVVLADADGCANERRRQFQDSFNSRRTPHPPAVSIVCTEEFEAWLLADAEAIRSVFGAADGTVAEPEKLAPREAKARWNNLCAAGQHDQRALRRDVVGKLSLERLKTTCRSFEQALRDLSAACSMFKSG